MNTIVQSKELEPRELALAGVAVVDPFPDDLRRWVGGEVLARTVTDAVTASGWHRPAGWRPQPDNSQAETMLGLLAYAYAAGVYASASIEIATYKDSTVRLFSPGFHPEAFEIQRFRRNHRRILAEVLSQVLGSSWRLASKLAPRRLPTPDPGPQQDAAADELAQRFHEAAERRIELAVLLDSVARDN